MSAYVGRLAFDPETDFHVDPDGRRIVTDDGGATWRYATDADADHVTRYQESAVGVQSTANEVAVFVAQGGTIDQARERWQHHFQVLPDDPHAGGLVFHPDNVGPEAASSTQASQASAEGDGT